jgi:ADP-heptose:LPS heptosyltransferase
VAALAAFLQRCRLLVSLNSGPAHLAAAMGTPVLSLFSGTDEVGRWAPWGGKVRVIQNSVPCSPCNLAVCPFDNQCMRLLGLEEAAEAMREMLAA